MNVRLVIAGVTLLAVWIGVETHAQFSMDFTEKKMDALFSSVTSPDAPGLAVLVRQNGKTGFERGYGLRDLRTKTKIDSRTNFRLASFTKQFTAMAIMLLVHEGKLHYDDKLNRFFPEFSAYGKDITVRNLLNHTSGLPDYEDLMEAEEKTRGPLWTPERQVQDEEVLQLLENAPPDFLPQVRAGPTAIPGTSYSAWLLRRSQESLSVTSWPSAFFLRCT